MSEASSERRLGGEQAAAATAAIRPAVDADLAAVRRIYAAHVLGGTGTFEETPPSLGEIVERWQGIAAQGLPYLVACHDDEVKGFAYAGRFRPRSGYRFTVEDSIYVAPEAVGCGLGCLLLAALIARCRDLGMRHMIAVIGDSANAASIRLHARQGFRHAGVLVDAGFKFGRWIDVVFMQRPLADGPGLGLEDESSVERN
ncbi:MAG: N-acetyltransferase [Rhodospirillales bacterium]|nr:N-acetyltransferase [Rhodospirillales bacterium]